MTDPSTTNLQLSDVDDDDASDIDKRDDVVDGDDDMDYGLTDLFAADSQPDQRPGPSSRHREGSAAVASHQMKAPPESRAEQQKRPSRQEQRQHRADVRRRECESRSRSPIRKRHLNLGLNRL